MNSLEFCSGRYCSQFLPLWSVKPLGSDMDTGDHEETGTRIFSCIPASLKGIHLAAALTSWHCLITVYLSFTQYQSLSVCVYVFAYPHKHSLKHIHTGKYVHLREICDIFLPVSCYST